MHTLDYYLKQFSRKNYDEFDAFFDLTSDYIYLYLFLALDDYDLINKLYNEIYQYILKKSKKFLKNKAYLLNIIKYTRSVIKKNIKNNNNQMEYIYNNNKIIQEDKGLLINKIKSILDLGEKEYILFKEYFNLDIETLKILFNKSLEDILWIKTEIMIKLKSKIDIKNEKDILEIFINQIKNISIPKVEGQWKKY